MAVAKTATQNMFKRIGFSDDVSDKLVDEEGLDAPDTFLDLTDERIKSIVYAIRRPGRVDALSPREHSTTSCWLPSWFSTGCARNVQLISRPFSQTCSPD